MNRANCRVSLRSNQACPTCLPRASITRRLRNRHAPSMNARRPIGTSRQVPPYEFRPDDGQHTESLCSVPSASINRRHEVQARRPRWRCVEVNHEGFVVIARSPDGVTTANTSRGLPAIRTASSGVAMTLRSPDPSFYQVAVVWALRAGQAQDGVRRGLPYWTAMRIPV